MQKIFIIKEKEITIIKNIENKYKWKLKNSKINQNQIHKINHLIMKITN